MCPTAILTLHWILMEIQTLKMIQQKLSLLKVQLLKLPRFIELKKIMLSSFLSEEYQVQQLIILLTQLVMISNGTAGLFQKDQFLNLASFLSLELMVIVTLYMGYLMLATSLQKRPKVILMLLMLQATQNK